MVPMPLQWGRDRSVAESRVLCRAFRASPAFNGAATVRSRKAVRIGLEKGLLVASMGPRPFGRGRYHFFAYPHKKTLLQWGRDLSVAEGTIARISGGLSRGASMGPRPFGCGRPLPHRTRSTRRCRFNGAATFRSRKVQTKKDLKRELLELQWGRDLSVAESRRPWRGPSS